MKQRMFMLGKEAIKTSAIHAGASLLQLIQKPATWSNYDNRSLGLANMFTRALYGGALKDFVTKYGP